MKVTINNQEIELNEGATVATIAADRNLPEKGVAVAVNNNMVPRGEWNGYEVKENDNIVILKAFCGG